MNLELQGITTVFFPSDNISKNHIFEMYDIFKQNKNLSISNFSMNTDMLLPPVEFPLLSFSIEDWKCSFRSNRIECQIRTGKDCTISENIFTPLISIFKEFSNNIIVNRLGLVARYKFDENIPEIKKHYLRKEFCEDTFRLEAIAFAKKITVENISAFDNVQITTTNPLIIRDINTGTLKENLHLDMLQKICNEATKLFSKSAIENIIYGSISK